MTPQTRALIEAAEAQQAISDAQDAIAAEPALREWSRCSVGDFPFQVRELLSYYRGAIRTINLLDEAKKEFEAANREKDAEIARLTQSLDHTLTYGNFNNDPLPAPETMTDEQLDEAWEYGGDKCKCWHCHWFRYIMSLRASVGEKWIEIKEGCEMPGDQQDILYVVTGSDHDAPFVLRGVRGWDGNDWFWCDMDGEMDVTGNDGDASYVSHWMPMVAPPSTEKES